jgi:peptidoglycan/xylan/chitin deacetylase (PgdA/CDA1 family)
MVDETLTVTDLPRRRPTVLMYHGFSVGSRADDPYDLHVSDTQLALQLDHLRRSRWTTVDLDRYLSVLDGASCPSRSVLVTIDDALRSVLDVAAPLLAAAGVPAVLFVPPGLLGGTTTWLQQQPREPLLDGEGLRAAQQHGIDIGVHGWDHSSMAGMSDADLRRSTVQARDAVADVTGRRPRAFAYPYGDHDRRAVAAVAAAGYEVGFSVYKDAGRHALSRTDVKPRDSVAALRLKLACGPRYRVAWRAAGVVGPTRRLLRVGAQRV